ncbi:hypothetical protein AALA22_15915 [Anaerovoracaceae bacterium 41-7]
MGRNKIIRGNRRYVSELTDSEQKMVLAAVIENLKNDGYEPWDLKIFEIIINIFSEKLSILDGIIDIE